MIKNVTKAVTPNNKVKKRFLSLETKMELEPQPAENTLANIHFTLLYIGLVLV